MPVYLRVMLQGSAQTIFWDGNQLGQSLLLLSVLARLIDSVVSVDRTQQEPRKCVFGRKSQVEMEGK